MREVPNRDKRKIIIINYYVIYIKNLLFLLARKKFKNILKLYLKLFFEKQLQFTGQEIAMKLN